MIDWPYELIVELYHPHQEERREVCGAVGSGGHGEEAYRGYVHKVQEARHLPARITTTFRPENFSKNPDASGEGCLISKHHVDSKYT